MIRVFVKVVFPDGHEILAGEIACGEPDGHGRIEGAFRATWNPPGRFPWIRPPCLFDRMYFPVIGPKACMRCSRTRCRIHGAGGF